MEMGLNRIEVGVKQEFRDALGEKILKNAKENGLEFTKVYTVDVYTIEGELAQKDLETISSELLSDKVIQDYSINSALKKTGFDAAIEVGFRPGVTDNVGKTTKEAIEELLGKKIESVYTSRQYLVSGRIDAWSAEKFASDFLANKLIENWRIKASSEYENGFEAHAPKVLQDQKIVANEISLDKTDEQLVELSDKNLLALSMDEMKIIKKYYSSEKVKSERKELGLPPWPTDVELEAIAQTWSEHCKHKIFNALIDYEDEFGKKTQINSLFKTYIRKATQEIAAKTDFLVSVFVDNAGVIKFDQQHNIAMKVETHNTPSALDPYGGAMTGIVGVNRDSLGTGKGGKLVFNTDVFCFAQPDYQGVLPPMLMHPKRIFEGVRKGVEHGGNKSGIPTINGSIVFHSSFLGKPLVYCGTCSVMPNKINGLDSSKKQALAGDLIIMVGGRTGKDGIHGATFSSQEINENSPVTAVQIGDPITQKKVVDFVLEAREELLYNSITDDGAGGISSAVGEMAKETGGCLIELDKAPLKYPGLQPWEILLSEAQERMTLSVSQNNLARLKELAEKHEVELSIIGKFTSEKNFLVKHAGKIVGCINMEFLHDGLPQMKLKAKYEKKNLEEPALVDEQNYNDALKKMLSRFNVCSKEFVVRQYDHEVQGGSVVKPLVGAENDGPSDAGITRPILSSEKGVVCAHGICPKFSQIDAYAMAANAVDEAIRNHVSVGGELENLAGLDNFCWCDPVQSEKTPDGEFKLAQLVKANQALYDSCTEYAVPCISGKDSMKNDYKIGGKKISVLPTLLFTTIGVISDSSLAVTMDAKTAGDLVYVIGETKNELGASEYYDSLNFLGANAPKVDCKKAFAAYKALNNAVKNRLVKSAHDCSDGGLGVALAEKAFAGNLGISVDLRKLIHAKDVDKNYKALFSESASRIIVTVDEKNKQEFEKTLSGNDFSLVGEVTSEQRLKIIGLNGEKIVDESIFELKKHWQKPFGV